MPDHVNATEAVGRQQAKSAETRRRILYGAAVVIRRDGVANLTLQRAADEAGVSKGGLLYHFGSKDELVQALLTRTLSDADDGLNRLVVDGRPAGFAHAYLEYVREPDRHPFDTATSIFATAVLDQDRLAPAIEQFKAWQERLVDDDGLDATLATLARVVGDGLCLIDLFDLAPPTLAQRSAIIDLVLSLVDASIDEDNG